MQRIARLCVNVLVWLLLCTLFLSGCQAYAPQEIASTLPGELGAAEYTFLESLYLFVSTDYGEFCAIVAVFMATHLVYLLRSTVYPWLATHAPRLADALKRACGSLLRLLKKAKNAKKYEQNGAQPPQLPCGDASQDEPTLPTDTQDKTEP